MALHATLSVVSNGGGRCERIGASRKERPVPLAGGRGAIRRAVWGYVCLVIMNMI